MRSGPFLLAALPLLFSACTVGRSPAPPTLAYALPDPAVDTYTRGDTANVDVDADGRTFKMQMAASCTLGASFVGAADGLRVSMHVRDFSGRLIQPMQDPMSFDKRAIDGPLVFTLDRKGTAVPLSQPRVTAPADRVFEPLFYVHTFFPRLPGGPVRTGSTWTDTIDFEGPAAGGTTRQARVLTYSVSGDTVVAGRRLIHLVLQGTSEETATGKIAGMEMDFTEAFTGTVHGWVLWDAARRLMVASYMQNDARGTIRVPMAPDPMDIHLLRVSRVRLGGGHVSADR